MAQPYLVTHFELNSKVPLIGNHLRHPCWTANGHKHEKKLDNEEQQGTRQGDETHQELGIPVLNCNDWF